MFHSIRIDFKRRKTQEDRYTLVPRLDASLQVTNSFFGVFDGTVGDFASHNVKVGSVSKAHRNGHFRPFSGHFEPFWACFDLFLAGFGAVWSRSWLFRAQDLVVSKLLESPHWKAFRHSSPAPAEEEGLFEWAVGCRLLDILD